MSADRHIAHVILTMRVGGAEKLVQDLSVDWVRRGGRASIACLDSADACREALVKHGVVLHEIRRRPIKFDWRVVRGLCKYVRQHNVQLLHAHDLSSFVYAATAGFFARVPVVMTEHSRHYLDERFLRRLEKRFFSFLLDALVEVSPQLADASRLLDGIPDNKITIITNGVDVDGFQTASGNAFRKELGIPDNAMLLGAVGRLEEIKGADVLLDAFALVKKQHPHAHLVYVGKGSLMDSLQTRVSENGLADSVHFAGVRTDIPQAMNALDMFVMPSRSEGLPFALLEAMAAGRPVVATHVGHIPDVISNTENGLLVPPENPEQLANAIGQVLDSEKMRSSFAKSGPVFVQAHYSQRVMFDAYVDLYEQLWGKRR